MSQLAHIIVDGPNHRMQLWWRHEDGSTELRHEIEAHTEAVGGTGYGPDALCPPGDYGLGDPQACATRNTDGSATQHESDDPAYGCWFTPLVDTNGLEAKYGRAGIGIHGGGSAAPDPFALRQEIEPTEGCIRILNIDNEQVFVPFVKTMKESGIAILVSVSQ